MELYGTLTNNLKAAVASARRLQGRPIHRDTLQFWSDLISEVRARRAAGEAADEPEVDQALAELEMVLADSPS